VCGRIALPKKDARRDLIRALEHKCSARDLDDGLKALSESEKIVREAAAPAGGDTSTIFYSIATLAR
jgi:hypothetical protein